MVSIPCDIFMTVTAGRTVTASASWSDMATALSSTAGMTARVTAQEAAGEEPVDPAERLGGRAVGACAG